MAGIFRLLDGPGEPVGAALAGQGRRLHQGPHALLEEEGIRLRPLDQELLERAERRVRAEERIEQLVGALGRQGIDPELAVVGLAAPGVLVLGAVVDEEQEARRGQALDEAVEQGLGLAVDPVQVLEDHHQRLDLALAQQQALDRVERLLAPLERIEGLPGRLVHRHVEERQEGGHGGPERRGERQDLPRDLLPDLPRVVAALDLEVAAEQLDHGQVGGGLAVGDRGGLHDQPAVHAMGVGELPEETRLAHARLPDHRDHLAVPLAGPVEGVAELLQLRGRGRRSA